MEQLILIIGLIISVVFFIIFIVMTSNIGTIAMNSKRQVTYLRKLLELAEMNDQEKAEFMHKKREAEQKKKDKPRFSLFG